MTGEIINLRRAAKRRDRRAEASEAAENRIRHGRTKAERLNDARTEAERLKQLDGLKRHESGDKLVGSLSGSDQLKHPPSMKPL